MNKICTTIEESKKLIELGIDVNTADMHYMYRHWEIDENTIGSQSDASTSFDSDFYYGADNGKTYHYIPAWSLAALFDILPDDTNIIKDKSDTENEKYMCTVGVKGDIISTFGNNPVDACYKMILKLSQPPTNEFVGLS